jgi:hypothetical protein
MPFNLLKNYPELLDLIHLNNEQRKQSLKNVFKRDIEDNPDFSFRRKRIWPIKGEDIPMQLLFEHLTTTNEPKQDENGRIFTKRIFEMDRSKRLHWIKFHIEESKIDDVFYFSVEDRIGGEDIVRTYIYDSEQKYVVVLEPQRKKNNYYLITAYYLNKPEGEKTILKKMKRKLPDVL